MEKIRVIITNNQKAVKVPTGVRMLRIPLKSA